MTADQETLRKRLLHRSWRRGTREMDLLLGQFAEKELRAADRQALDDYARLLDESDPDIYDWVTGRGRPDDASHRAIIQRIARFHGLSGGGGR
jgi:antitoxin CptB